MFIDFIEVKNENEGFAIGVKKMTKLKFLKKSFFSKNSLKITVKVIKKASILNKNLILVTRRAGRLILDSRIIRCQENHDPEGWRHIDIFFVEN